MNLESAHKLKKKDREVSSKPVFPRIIEDRLPGTSLLYRLVFNNINTNAAVTFEKKEKADPGYHSFSEKNKDSRFMIQDSSFQNGGGNVDRKRKKNRFTTSD